jgi:hypothetical protein
MAFMDKRYFINIQSPYISALLVRLELFVPALPRSYPSDAMVLTRPYMKRNVVEVYAVSFFNGNRTSGVPQSLRHQRVYTSAQQ